MNHLSRLLKLLLRLESSQSVIRRNTGRSTTSIIYYAYVRTLAPQSLLLIV
jgi:hypothetical protein